ncbi:MAG: UPF0179 family protein [Candidatus Thermoplasmatota archaeon]|nr:UPF0179 family protein [Candidatus Thermoplasmatota archaeon]
MAKISLIGVDLAREGSEFTFVEPLTECSSCRIRNVCFSLEPGTKYRITKIREKQHPCLIFNKNKVATIEVEQVENYLNIPEGVKLQEGSAIKPTSLHCEYITCPNVETCNLIHMREGQKFKIQNIGEKVDCPKGYNLRKVTITTK